MEPIQKFVIRLKSVAPDCEFTCSNCQHDIQEQHNIKDQLIRGLFNEILQTDILAKASHLQFLADIIRHVKAFEAAQCDHNHLQQLSEVQAFRSSSSYRKTKSYSK